MIEMIYTTKNTPYEITIDNNDLGVVKSLKRLIAEGFVNPSDYTLATLDFRISNDFVDEDNVDDSEEYPEEFPLVFYSKECTLFIADVTAMEDTPTSRKTIRVLEMMGFKMSREDTTPILKSPTDGTRRLVMSFDK